MKKLFVFALILSFFLISCGKKDDAKKEDGKKETKEEVNKQFSNLTYKDWMLWQDDRISVEAVIKNTDSIAYSLYADYKVSNLEKTTENLKGFPVEIHQYDADAGIEIKMLLPNGIYLEIENQNPLHVPSYRNLEMMKNFLLMFDLDGLSKITGDTLPGKGESLQKYFPKL